MSATPTLRSLAAGLALMAGFVCGSPSAKAADALAVERQVRSVIEPVMREVAIPGMAVVVIENGRRHHFNFGVDAPSGGKPVTADTLFELGSLSKTFTATLGATAEAAGRLSLADAAERYEPALAGHPLGRATLLDLATYTAAGLPLQFPDDVSGADGILRYFQTFRPEVEPGAVRLYSNPSIGLFGELAGRALGPDFATAMTREILPGLGLASTFLAVPQSEMARYAHGTAPGGGAIRVSPGALDGPAYGLKTSAADMARFLEVEIDPSSLAAPLRAGVEATHLGHFQVGPMVQGLGWEQYSYPVDVETLVAGNSADMALKPQVATRLQPPKAPQGAVLFNKTGSTRGFGAYAAFVPERRIGVVFLANRNWPNEARVRAGHAILSTLD